MRGESTPQSHPDHHPRQQQGQYTTVVYGLIRKQRYQEAVAILSRERQKFPKSRAALSLLSYCYFHMQVRRPARSSEGQDFIAVASRSYHFTQINAQDYPAAAATYEALLEVCPDVEEYRVYLAQALYKAGCYHEASRAAARVESPRYARRMLLLQVGGVVGR